MMANLLDVGGKKPLNDDDLAALARSWIDADSAERAGLWRVSSLDGSEIVGRKASDGNFAGIVFPCMWPGESWAFNHILRLDAPPLERRGAEIRERQKYLVPPGAANRLYFVPGTPAPWIQDTSLPILLTEGPKKTIALNRLATHALSDANEQPRFLAIGLGGVWNWRGKVGIESGPRPGDRRTVRGPIPDLDRLEWRNRQVIVVFDSDASTNVSVQEARRQLGLELQRRGAIAQYVDIPGDSATKVGVDDFLGTHGPERVLKLLKRPRAFPRLSKASQAASRFAEHLRDVEFFRSTEDQLFATFSTGDHKQTWPLRSSTFSDWLQLNYYRKHGEPASQHQIKDVLNVCCAKAQFEGKRLEVGVRVMADGDTVYIDMGDKDWHVIEVNSETWRVVPDSTARFRRARGTGSLPWPVPGGSLAELRTFLNTGDGPDGDAIFILLVSWLIEAYNPKGPYPVLILQGEQGSSKSTQARLLRSLVDPNSAPTRSMPKEERDLVIAASNSRVLSFDNLSGLPPWVSDALCRISTGGGFAARQLHTDGEEIVFNSMRPIILNGIDQVASRDDLADRAVNVFLPAIPEGRRRREAEFWDEFAAASGRILGALLDHVCAALKHRSEVRLQRYPRMADFVSWVSAATMGHNSAFSGEEFRQAFTGQQRHAASDITEGSPFALALLAFVKEVELWEGTATELLNALNSRRKDQSKLKDWPTTAMKVGDQIRRLTPALRNMDVSVETYRRGHKNTRIIRLKTTPEQEAQ